MEKNKHLPIIVDPNQLPESIFSILGELAQNVHDTWAYGRKQEGWTYGALRNDEKKEHPSLVPFDELSESEKEYDKRTVLATLSVLMKYDLLKTE
jgi:hypothetical protein